MHEIKPIAKPASPKKTPPPPPPKHRGNFTGVLKELMGNAHGAGLGVAVGIGPVAAWKAPEVAKLPAAKNPTPESQEGAGDGHNSLNNTFAELFAVPVRCLAPSASFPYSNTPFIEVDNDPNEALAPAFLL